MSAEAHPSGARTKAEVRRSWWPGWIWAIPIAALLLVGWWTLRAFMTGGEDITISFADAHGLKHHNTSVLYRGMQVGQVKDVELSKSGDAVTVTVHIDDSATRFLRAGTQFWLRGANPDLSDLSSLGSVISGPTVIMDPGPGAKTTQFTGLTRKPVISGAHEPPQLFEVSLPGAVGELTEGEPVKLLGFAVGEVKTVGFRYDTSTGSIETPVTLALYPSLFHIGNTAGDGSALNDAIGRLIRRGLRARLDRDPPIVGDPQVSLALEPGASGGAPVLVDGLPQIPAASGGGLDSVVDRINRLPLEQIAQNLLDITHHVDGIVASQQISDAVSELDATLKQVHRTTSSAGPKITDLVDRLRRTADRIDAAAKAAQGTAEAADKAVGGAPTQNGMQSTMQEVTEAARSVRELANYLDSHPEALIQGRSGE